MQDSLWHNIKKSKMKDDSATLLLLEQFQPIIKKYARLLKYEDAANDLTLFFLELIDKIDLAQFCGSKRDFELLSYIGTSIRREYILLSKNWTVYQANNLLMDDFGFLGIYVPSAEDQALVSNYSLLPIERKIINGRMEGFSSTEIAKKLGISRQTLYRHLRKARRKVSY